MTEPAVVQREAQPYAAITARVTMAQLGEVVPPLTGEVFGWLAGRGIQPAGPALWKYDVIDMEGELEVETGVAIAVPAGGAAPEGDERVLIGVLPAGRYAEVRFHGHPDGLAGATGELLDWADREGHRWDVTTVDGTERWTARLEEYLDDPDEVPDLNDWTTVVAIKLAD